MNHICRGHDGATGTVCGRERHELGTKFYCPNVACDLWAMPHDASGKRVFTDGVERADCHACDGKGSVKVLQGDGEYLDRCEACLGYGVQLRREDYLTAEAA